MSSTTTLSSRFGYPPVSAPGRGLAIAAGCAFTSGGLTILLGDALLRPSEWTSYHALTVLTVFGTIAAGHLMADAARARHHLAVTGFLVLFVVGTGLVVYQSVGRQAEVTDTRASSAEARNQAIADKRADLATGRQRLADADKMVEIETRKGGCRSNCQDWKQRASEVRSHVKLIEAEIATLGAPAPVSPKATKMADVAALFGLDHARAKTGLMLLEPFLWTLFFEIGSIVSLGFAFRQAPVVPVITAADVAEWVPQPPKGGRREKPGPKRNEAVIEFVAEFRKRHGRNPSTPELQARFASIPRSTAHRYASAA